MKDKTVHLNLKPSWGDLISESSDGLTLFSGYQDKNGTLINHGDIVKFFFDADYGHGDNKSGYTEMIDVCFFDKDHKEFYLINDCGGCAFVWRHNEHCEVIGNVKKDKDLLNQFSEESLSKMFPDIFSGSAKV